MSFLRFLLAAGFSILGVATNIAIADAAIANGFQDTVVATVASPSVIAFAPDGRLFIGEKASGKIRVYKAGTLLAQPFLDLNDFVPAGAYFDTFFERGLLGIAFDPSFASTGFVYVYYTVCKTPGNPSQPGTATCQSAKNRVARFVATGDVVAPASQVLLLDDIDSDAGNHNAGWVGFGPLDGRLYLSTGDGGATNTKAQSLASLNGKILRLNPNGSIPPDNPFVGQAGARGEIWAYGFRNPYRCRFAGDGRLICGDVGNYTAEELDLVTRGANYGWPTTEGLFDAASYPQLTNPIHSYAHPTDVSAAVIGGDFGSKTNFPGDYQQSYFFADFGMGRIQRALLDAAGTAVQSVDDLLTGLGSNKVTDVVAGPDGSLYYTAYSANQVRRITAVAVNRSPIAAASADVVTGLPPLTVQFSSVGSSDPDGDSITYGWNFGDGSATSPLANPSHQYTAAGTHTATLTVSDGKSVPGPGTDTIVIAVGRPPVVAIASPVDGASFRGGDTVVLNGSATDPDDGPLPSASLHWRVIFHHADHIHPYIDDLPGAPQSFSTTTSGETDSDVAYEILLSATDSSGLTGTASVGIFPLTSEITLQTDPAGLSVTLDGQPKTGRFDVSGVVGVTRTIGAPTSQTRGNQTYLFAGWSDGGLPTHQIATPPSDTTFTASYAPPYTCNAPLVIPPQGGTISSATGGTGSLGGTCASSTSSPEQVFQWTPSSSGAAIIATCDGSTSFDTVMYVRTGACASGSQLVCADDTAGCGTNEPNDHHASRTTLSVTAGQIYFIVVDGYNGANGTFTLTVTPPSPGNPTATRTPTPVPTASRTATAVAPTPSLTPLPTRTTTPAPAATVTTAPSPAGCSAAVQVPPQGGVFTGTTTGASAFAGTCAVTGNSPDRVFQWTPAASGSATIATCGGTTAFDTALYVRAGSCQGTQVACSDDAARCGTAEPNDHHASRLVTNVTAGQTYFIVVDGYNGARGNFTLTITPPNAPTATATATPAPSLTASGATAATAANAAPTASFTPPVRTATDTPLPTATPLPSATATATSTAAPVATATPAADACAATTVVPPEGGTFNGATSGASTQEGSCGVTNKSGEHVYQWTPNVSGPATIGTCGAGTLHDTVVYLRSGACDGSELACVDDVGGCNTGEPSDHHGSRINAIVSAGQTYFIIVDGYNGDSGPFSLTITPPPGGGCSAPFVVPPNGGVMTGTTAGTSGLGSCAQSGQSPEHVYQWTPSRSGTATIETCGGQTNYDTVLYMSATVCGGAALGCIDDTPGCGTAGGTGRGSRLTPTVTAGQTYFIVIDGYDGSSGNYSLSVIPPP